MNTPKNESGQSLVIVLLSMSVLLGFAGLAVDVGSLLYSKRLMQTAADAAAIAGATEQPYLNAVPAAKIDATNLGFTQGNVAGPRTGETVHTTVIVNNPPLNGPHTGIANSNYVEVVITKNVPVFFMSLFGRSQVPVTVRSVAALQNGPGCIYVMDPVQPSAMLFNGILSFVNVNVPNCAVYVNSNNATAMSIQGVFSSVNLTARSIGIVGGYSAGGFLSGSNLICTAGGACPKTGITPVADPLSFLVQPNPSLPCTTTGPPTGSVGIAGGTGNTNVLISTNVTATLSPGTYCGTGGQPAIKIADPSGFAHVTFNPGTYVLYQGGLTIQNAASIAGNGVTIYMTGLAINAPALSVSGFTSLNLSAPTTGTYNGILFWENRLDPNTISTIGCGGFCGSITLMRLAGAVYMPKTQLTFGGQPLSFNLSIVQLYNILVTNTLTFQNFVFLQDYATLTGSSPIKGAVMAE